MRNLEFEAMSKLAREASRAGTTLEGNERVLEYYRILSKAFELGRHVGQQAAFDEVINHAKTKKS